MTIQTDTPAIKNLRAPTGNRFWQDLCAEIASDRPIYGLGATYCIAALGLSVLLAGSQPVNVLMYAPIWASLVVPGLFLFLCVRTLPGIIRERPTSPTILLAARMSAYITPRAVAGLMLIALQVLLTGAFTSVKTMLPAMSGYVWDQPLADIDAMLHAGIDPWLFLSAIVSHPAALHLIEFFYASIWMVMIGLVPAIVALSPVMAPIRVRFFVTYILCWVLLGNVFAGVFLSAGPAYFAEFTGDLERFRPLLDHVAANSGSLWSAFDIQRSLWFAHENNAVALGTGISAFPSVHIAMATLWTILAFRSSIRLGIAALAFLLIILVGSVALGWHYAIDGYASIIVTMLIWKVVGWILPSHTPQAPETGR